MSTNTFTASSQFRDAMAECKRLYITAARQALEEQGETDTAAQQSFVRRMVDLHKGLLIKIYCTVAKADAKWSREERQLAQDLIRHVWNQQLDDDELRQAARNMFQESHNLSWYSLIRPFDQVRVLRDRVAELETLVIRLANLVAKIDGQVCREETDALRTIQQEIDVHLHRLPLEEPKSHDADRKLAGHAMQRVAEESTQVNQQYALQDSGTIDLHSEDSTESLEDTLAELDSLIGLTAVKREIQTLTNFLNLQKHREAAGLPKDELSLHMVFMGNPGTGKTTVARIVGRILKALGLLKRGHLVETDRSGLVAEFAGQTGPKTNRKIDEALDGVLFIDEAYSLVASKQEDAYGMEAIQTLVKRIEDDRDRLVVILAGYPDPMQDLLESNPGLTSRFNTKMTFDDYSPSELGYIYQRMCGINHYELPARTRGKLLLGFHWLYESRDQHFGNGRLARNIFEDSLRCLANRIADVTPVTRELLTVLHPEDVELREVPRSVLEALDSDAMRFTTECNECHKELRVKIKHLGARVRCPHCRSKIQVEWGLPVVD
jgi:SpoVK/Ycf46/Vps4 family AAA+-type ATPase